MRDESVPYDFHISKIGTLPSIAKVQERINTAYDTLYITDKWGDKRPHVCTICDELILDLKHIKLLRLSKLKTNQDLLRWDVHHELPNRRIPAIEECFTYSRKTVPDSELNWLKDLALSPRGLIEKKTPKANCKPTVVCCDRCKKDIEASKTPVYAIINKNYAGCAPTCLTDLSQVELALLTPVKSYGYCLSFDGGPQKSLKGTFTFMRVEPRQVSRAAIHLEQMGLTGHVVVLLNGRMTEYQRDKARAAGTIRVDHVLRAAEWLVEHNVRWQSVNLEEFREKLKGVSPAVVDNSKTVASENANVEEEELFTCYFPDGAQNANAGGFDEPGAFKTYVERMRKDNYNVELQLDLGKEFVRESDGDLLVNASLLQFPYGICGMDETRLTPNGSYSSITDVPKFLMHYSQLSQGCFQYPMFQLVMYSITSKIQLLKKSRLQLKGKKNAQTLADGLTGEDVTATIRGRRDGYYGCGTAASNLLLNSVDAMSKALPHTNEASKAARSNGESMQHHHGIASIFLTVTFDDENSFLIQVLSQEEIDDDRDISDLTEDELVKRAQRRREVRLKYPGLASMHFEMLLIVLCREVIGWDMTNDCPTAEPGLFGMCMAFSLAIEEQGRKTLHGHMSLWIKGFRQLQKDVFFGNLTQKDEAGTLIADYHDHLVTTEFFGSMATRRKQLVFDHECLLHQEERQGPIVVNDQALRDMRHRFGFEKHNGLYAFCPHCEKKWTYEQLMLDMLHKDECMDGAEPPLPPSNKNKSHLPKPRMQALMIEFQKNVGAETDETPVLCINAHYQRHKSCHVKSCFRCQKNEQKAKKHVCSAKCECRMRLPDRARQKSLVATISEGTPWYKWNGEMINQPLVEFQPKRGVYDCFQNVSCKAISESKFTCNSNASLITDGPVSQYQFKYQHKGTQEQDTAEYAGVERSMKTLNGRTHEEDSREACRLICRAAFAHNKSNVISAPMANYLIRNQSRFYFSHKFQYCPLKDVRRLLNNQDVNGTVVYGRDGNVYFENQALHYLCRSADLENVSLKAFTEEYEITYASKKRKANEEREAYPFQADTGYFQHPSVHRKGRHVGASKQAAKMREEPTSIKVSQWTFGDTTKFGNNILTCASENITSDMEKYAETVLTLLLPHRCKDDLMLSGAYTTRTFTQRLQKVYQDDMMLRDQDQEEKAFTVETETFLQNIQDCAHNSMRYKLDGDDLSRNTEKFEGCGVATVDSDDEEEQPEEEDLSDYAALAAQLELEDVNDENPEYLSAAMKNFNLSHVRNTGSDNCGYNMLLEMKDDFDQHSPEVNGFVEQVQNGQTLPAQSARHQRRVRQRYAVRDIIKVLLTRKKTVGNHGLFRDENPDVMEANGSVESILDWARAAHLDRIQKRAFESIVAAFVLSFYDGEDDDSHLSTVQEKMKFRRMKNHLLKLKGGSKPNDVQLICLLHGPGGSGKSTVINLVTGYAKKFCALLGHEFSARTIVITAMSGVAATLLHGETVHAAVGLNRKITDEEIDQWTDARLLIVDEISFANEGDFDNMYRKTQTLMMSRYKHYGGLSVVFAGDYSQLEPCQGGTIYSTGRSETFHGALNVYVELDGAHRFREDPAWGKRLLRFRRGKPTLEDIKDINFRCRTGPNHTPPDGCQVATYYNRNRDAVNTAVFEKYCAKHKQGNGVVFKGAVVVLMDDLQVKTDKQSKEYTYLRSNHMKKCFYEQCGEDALKTPDNRERVDPFLKLYPNCPMMHTQNTDVPKGQANGSRVLLKKIRVKSGEQPIELLLSCGTTIRAYFARQIKCLVVQHEARDIRPAVFQVATKSWSFTSKFDPGYGKIQVHLKGRQFPLISNSATTGHKLQGCTMLALYAQEWQYRKNWAYVVLSRVTTMLGLYLNKPLTEDLKKYEMPLKMTAMLAEFEQLHTLEAITPDQYTTMIKEANEIGAVVDINIL